MSIRAFHNESTLGAHRFLKSNSKVENLNKQVADSTRLHIVSDDVVNFKVSKSLGTNSLTSKVTIENLDAADSTIPATCLAKEIATLTQNYIVKRKSVVTK